MGPHLVAPTGAPRTHPTHPPHPTNPNHQPTHQQIIEYIPAGSDLARFGEKGTVFAGYHYDLNFLTIHGKSRFPGLHVWLRDGRKARRARARASRACVCHCWSAPPPTGWFRAGFPWWLASLGPPAAAAVATLLSALHRVIVSWPALPTLPNSTHPPTHFYPGARRGP